jgi:hypothetical protein
MRSNSAVSSDACQEYTGRAGVPLGNRIRPETDIEYLERLRRAVRERERLEVRADAGPAIAARARRR